MGILRNPTNVSLRFSKKGIPKIFGKTHLSMFYQLSVPYLPMTQKRMKKYWSCDNIIGLPYQGA